MLAWLFHAWERHLVAATKDRVVYPFEWGLDWIPNNGAKTTTPYHALTDWVTRIMADTDRFFGTPPIEQYSFDGYRLQFPSAYETPHPENNLVHARYFPTTSSGGPSTSRRAVVVLPQWNAQPEASIALSRLLAKTGISALRLSLPYHDQRMPPELHRADYIVSANVGRTIQVCRQAVLDTRRAVDWLVQQGYQRIGILGTSLGSCLAMLAVAHDRRIRVAAFNHISPYFADVVWEGLSTAHVRAGLESSIDLERLRALWLPISPQPFISRMKDKRVLLVYARYDLSFPVRLSRQLVDEFQRQAIPHRVCTLPCGHYSTGIVPFSWLDGYALITFLRKNL